MLHWVLKRLRDSLWKFARYSMAEELDQRYLPFKQCMLEHLAQIGFHLAKEERWITTFKNDDGWSLILKNGATSSTFLHAHRNIEDIYFLETVPPPQYRERMTKEVDGGIVFVGDPESSKFREYLELLVAGDCSEFDPDLRWGIVPEFLGKLVYLRTRLQEIGFKQTKESRYSAHFENDGGVKVSLAIERYYDEYNILIGPSGAEFRFKSCGAPRVLSLLGEEGWEDYEGMVDRLVERKDEVFDPSMPYREAYEEKYCKIPEWLTVKKSDES